MTKKVSDAAKTFTKSIPCSGGIIFQIKAEESSDGKFIISNFEMSINSEGNISSLNTCWIDPAEIENLGNWFLAVADEFLALNLKLKNSKPIKS